jgi:small-conductance mechanosensitive channel
VSLPPSRAPEPSEEDTKSSHSVTTRSEPAGPRTGIPYAVPELPESLVKARRSVAQLGRRFRRSTAAGLLAIAGFTLARYFGGVLGDAHHRPHGATMFAAIGSGVFLLFGLVAVRSATQALLHGVPAHLGDARAAALRLLCLLTGYVVVVIGTLAAINVPVSRLVLGGVAVSVLAGIAAQQALGNVFAGLVLLVAKPFVVGEEVTVRSGALGGVITGRVVNLTLVHVVLETDDGLVLLPNAGVLAAAIGPTKPPGWQGPDTRRFL